MLSKRGDVGTDSFFRIALAVGGLLIILILIYLFKGGISDIIASLPFGGGR